VFSGLRRAIGNRRSRKESRRGRQNKEMRRGVRIRPDDQLDLEDGEG
jgi:hypothetical protein